MTHVHRNRWRVDRRHVLRGAGLSLALPFLRCMRTLRPAPKPRRSVFLYVPNGVNTLTWQIRAAGADYELTEPLRPLAKHRAVITPISGLHHPSGIGRAHECDKIWLTGASFPEKGRAFRNTVSADQLMAEVTAAHSAFPSLELAVTGKTLAWSRDGVPLPAERKPRLAFERLFGIRPGGIEKARRELVRRRSVLDVVLEDARKFRRAIGTEDRIELDDYLSAVRAVELRTARAQRWLDVPMPSVSPETRSRLRREIPDSAARDYYRTMFDLIVLALRTDRTRVVTCMLGNESRALALPELGIPQQRHELSHHSGDPERMRKLTLCDTFLVDQLAYLLDRLESCREPGGTLLDRTMVLFGSGMSYGHSHGNANLPLILAGGRALGLKHGRHLDYNLPEIGSYHPSEPERHYAICLRPVDGRARLSNLLLTMLQRMGVGATSFADSVGTIDGLV